MHEFHRIVEASVIPPYGIRVTFEDGVVREIDLGPMLHGQVFGPLRDAALFAQMKLDPEAGTVVWPTEADFHPDTLYNWDDLKDEIISTARSWAATPV